MLMEFTFAHGLVDAREFLIDDSSGADIEVTDFGVAHLAFWQSHRFTISDEFVVGVFLMEVIDERRIGLSEGVSGGYLAVPPSVEDDE